MYSNRRPPPEKVNPFASSNRLRHSPPGITVKFPDGIGPRGGVRTPVTSAAPTRALPWPRPAAPAMTPVRRSPPVVRPQLADWSVQELCASPGVAPIPRIPLAADTSIRPTPPPRTGSALKKAKAGQSSLKDFYTSTASPKLNDNHQPKSQPKKYLLSSRKEN